MIMKIIILFFYISQIWVLFSLKLYAFGKPESDISPATGYEIPCYTSTLDIPNIESYFTSDSLPISNSTKIMNNEIIFAKCKSKYYVFDQSREADSPPQNAFSLKCINGGFKKVKPSEFCDERCNISDLPLLGFGTSVDIILPGEKTTVQCPSSKISAYGASFEIQCGINGLLTANSPLCFLAEKACNFNGKKFPEGAKLSCADDTGLTFVICESSIWQQESIYNKTLQDGSLLKDSCRETVSEVEFKYQDLNELSINTLPAAVTISDIEDFCKAHPDDSGCSASVKSCSYHNTDYAFGTSLVLKCPGYQSAEIQFQCIEVWSFIKFMDSEHPLAKSTFASYDSCPPFEATLISVIPPESKTAPSNQTLDDKKVEAWKDYKDGMQDGNSGS